MTIIVDDSKYLRVILEQVLTEFNDPKWLLVFLEQVLVNETNTIVPIINVGIQLILLFII